MTVYALAATDAGGEAAVRRAVDERRAAGGGQAAFLDAPLEELAIAGAPDARRAALDALAQAGPDCAGVADLAQPRPGGG